jgi:(2Fe-2S) ferredoxin
MAGAEAKGDEGRAPTLAEKMSDAMRSVASALGTADHHEPAASQALASGIVARVGASGETSVTTFVSGTLFLVCTNERPSDSPLPCCARRGGSSLLRAFRAELARRGYPRGVMVAGSTCLTSCQCGPTVVVYPDAIWYGGVTEADVAELFDVHLSGRGKVERLLLPSNVRVW